MLLRLRSGGYQIETIAAVVACGAGWAVTALAHEPFIGLPVSVFVRLLGGQALHNYLRREKLDHMVAVVDESRKALTSSMQNYLPLAMGS